MGYVGNGAPHTTKSTTWCAMDAKTAAATHHTHTFRIVNKYTRRPQRVTHTQIHRRRHMWDGCVEPKKTHMAEPSNRRAQPSNLIVGVPRSKKNPNVRRSDVLIKVYDDGFLYNIRDKGSKYEYSILNTFWFWDFTSFF